MDYSLLEAAVALGLSWGALLWGPKPEPTSVTAPCVCHCECSSTGEGAYPLKLIGLVFILILSWVAFA